MIEIGPGRGALTDEIIKKKPSSLILIEKDLQLTKELKRKYSNNKMSNLHTKKTKWIKQKSSLYKFFLIFTAHDSIC